MAMENPLKNGCVNGNSGKTIYTDIYIYTVHGIFCMATFGYPMVFKRKYAQFCIYVELVELNFPVGLTVDHSLTWFPGVHVSYTSTDVW